MKEIKKYNDIDRNFLEEFIASLPHEDKIKLKEYAAANPRSSSSAFFSVIKSYVWNTYFRPTPGTMTKQRSENFVDIFNSLLVEEEENDGFEDS